MSVMETKMPGLDTRARTETREKVPRLDTHITLVNEKKTKCRGPTHAEHVKQNAR